MPLVEPLSAVSNALRTAGIVPDVLPESFTPSGLVGVALHGTSVELKLGEEVPLAHTTGQPQLSVVAAPSEAITADGLSQHSFTYTVAMLDPDAPSAAQPTSRHFRHWVVCFSLFTPLIATYECTDNWACAFTGSWGASDSEHPHQ
ncbi:hypothetical protein MIND_01277100 [Mycena indigotica]|uniref:Uncharacterized protein n=1 Tax=Mycena indigotica TaxID=2126181 RepID=A0A8H6S3F2_9AGAR|nr:uncharacterized protein MIND_01277100 [Mycena indigotica]KAF7291326.1 hypothetical protein MIND_01277100 [Mycena indigotica]